ncbi:BMP family lipoprotein [Alicyclobacillus acidiphilus]|uniref:BMP family lipoprotein n=1 Tax=Alicyclobacillus acidiphilus TaxID=182455 RepID=UPI00082EE240|nr:BMP family ABC transporter substrate-binding protein [Alicyclobacillus acidiphilus]
MNKKKIASTAGAFVVLSAMLAGCGTNNTSSNAASGSNTTNATNAANSANTANNANSASTAGAASVSTIKVGLVTDTGGLNDHGFNHLADVGLNRAQKQLGVQTAVVQSNSESDYVPNLSSFAQKGYKLVIAVGYLMDDAVKQVAREYPKTDFMIIDDTITGIPNVSSAVFQSEQAGYLVGVMAGLLQKQDKLKGLNSKNTVGVVGGQPIPPVDSYIAGFKQAFKKEDPTGNVLIQYTNDFNDAAMGSQVAQNEIAQGADIIFQDAGGAGLGAITAAQHAGVYAIGVDTDQAYLAPKTILTSAMKGVDTSVFDTIKAVKEGKFKSGVVNYNLKNNGVGIGTVLNTVPKSVVQAVNQAKQQIISGKIHVSSTLSNK